MSAEAGWNLLNHARKTLREKFDQTEADWRDQVRVEFETQEIEPIEHQLEITLRAIRKVAEVLRQARRTVAPHRDED